jgi:effector-binding domain-containing protein
MKFLKYLLYTLGAIAALVVTLGIFARKDYHIERSIEIEAPRAVVYDQVRFFRNFAKWSPWGKIDPNMQVSYDGIDGVPGATYCWEGNSDVGKGTQTLKSANPDRIDIEVKFTEPWASTSPAFFVLEDKGEKTRVSWGFDMHVGFPWNAMAMLTDINRGVGKDYERGLGNLKKLCENIMHPRYNGYEVTESDMPAQYFVGLRDTIKIGDIQDFYSKNMPKIIVSMLDTTKTAGTPSGLYWLWDDKNQVTDMAAALQVATETKQVTGGYTTFVIPAGKALTVEYFGTYDSIGNAHRALDLYIAEKKLQQLSPVVESYITEPAKEPDTSKWLTKVIYWVAPMAKDSVK